MKKFKFIIIFGLIFIALGLVITGAAYNYGRANYSNSADTETYAQNFDIDAARSILISGVTANVYIEKGDRFSVVAENIPEDSLQVELTQNGVLEISGISGNNKTGANRWNINLGFIKIPVNFGTVDWRNPGFIFSGWNGVGIGILNDIAKIYIYIPDGKKFDSVRITDNVGSIIIDEIECNELRILSNVGSVTIDSFHTDLLNITEGVGRADLTGTVGSEDINGSIFIDGRVGTTNLNLNEPSYNEVYIGGGVGTVNIDAVINNYVRVDGGVGNVRWNGAINGDLTVDGGVGSIVFNLAGNIDDYNIQASSGVGSIHINGVKHKNVGNYDYNYNADYEVTINGGVGSIKLDIK